MNAQRRKRIGEIIILLEGIKTDIEAVQEEEQNYYESMPENLQAGDKGQVAEAAADSLQQAVDEVDNAINSLNSSIE
jgi:hypothetical protein